MIPTHTDKSLDIFQLVFYIPLFFLCQYLLIRHGKRGILGWFYAVAFCIIRIVASALKLHADIQATPSSGSVIVDNIGLSPLILAALGFLHQARSVRGSIRSEKIEWLAVLQIHVLVTAGLALIAVGISSLLGTDPSDSDWALLKAGFAIVFIGWGLVSAGTLFSFRRPALYHEIDSNVFCDGTILLNAVFFSLPFILLRAIYGSISLFGSGNSIGSSSFSSNVAADVIMNVVPQLFAVIIYVVAGLRTVSLKAAMERGSKANSHPLV